MTAAKGKGYRPHDYVGFAIGQLTKRNHQETLKVILAMHSGAVLELYVSKGEPSHKLRLPSSERKDVAGVVVCRLSGWGLLIGANDCPAPKGVRGQSILNKSGMAVAAAWNGKLPL